MRRWTWFGLALALSIFGLAQGADGPAVSWSISADTKLEAGRGQSINLVLKGTIPSKHHTYSTRVYSTDDAYTSPTDITVSPASLAKINGAITYSKPKIVKDIATGKEIVEEFFDSVTFTIPLTIDPAAPLGEQTLTMNVNSTVCDEEHCYPATDHKIEVKLVIKEGTVAAKVPAGDPPPEKNSAHAEGLWAYLEVAMLAGFGALFTPCVFPMVPITVSFFTKRKQTTRAQSIRDAGIFSAGIIGTFTVLGFLVALTFGATSINVFASDPFVNLGFAALVMFFALNLFGVYEIQIPSVILNRLNQTSSQGEGLVSVLLMGLLFALTSFTCTGPFVGVTLVAAAGGEWLWPLIGMLGFSTVFASPFFLLALFPAAMKSLPKSGGWLNSVKVVLGFIEVGFALKYLSGTDLVWRWGFLTREVFLCIWIALAILITAYLLGRFQLTHDTPVENVGGVRVLFAAGFLSLGVWLATGLLGHELGPLDSYLPQSPYPGTERETASSDPKGETGKLTWINNFDDALAESRRTNTPLFVDFTGYTCANCNANERKIFPDPEVKSLLSKFVRARLYTDDRKDAESKAQSLRYLKMEQDRFKTAALPLYVVISPSDMEVGKYSGLIRDSKDFASFLSNAFAKSADTKPVASQ